MKVLELFSLSKGKSLQDFDWGASFIDVINVHLPVKHRVTDVAIQGDFLYAQLLQLPSDEMLDVMNLTVEIRGNVITVTDEDSFTDHPSVEESYKYDKKKVKKIPEENSEESGTKSRFPTIALICAMSLVVLCLGLAVTQAVLSVKYGRQVGDGRTVTSIASIIGDVVKAFVDSGNPNTPSRQPRNRYDDYYEEDPYYDRPQRPTRPTNRRQPREDQYDTVDDPEAPREPVRPHSGDGGEAPPYD